VGAALFAGFAKGAQGSAHEESTLREQLLGPGILVKKETQSAPKLPLMEVFYR
jgi:hypothetical protein